MDKEGETEYLENCNNLPFNLLKIVPKDISFGTTAVWILVADKHLINHAKFLFITSSDVMRELLLNVWQRPLPDRVFRSD